MAPAVIVIYEIVYGIFFFGVLFSKTTLLTLFPASTTAQKILFVLVLFCGFYLPLFLHLLKIRVRKQHCAAFLTIAVMTYLLAAVIFYTRAIDKGRFERFHPFLQIIPTEQVAAIPKPRDVFRIICLGGSTTEEFRTTGDSYPDYLGMLLQQYYPQRKIEVLNAGKFFYSTQHAIIHYLFYIKELEPDLIIFFEAANDLITSFTMPPMSSAPFRRDYGHFFGALGYLRYPKTFGTRLADFFYADLRAPELKAARFTDFKSYASFVRNLKTIIELTTSAGIPLILANQAHRFSTAGDGGPAIDTYIRSFLLDREHYADEKSWYKGMELFNSAAMNLAQDAGIPFVDQASFFRGKKELFTDPWHMVIQGRELKAQLFFEKIVELRIIEKNFAIHAPFDH